jgi:hypothetical protein
VVWVVGLSTFRGWIAIAPARRNGQPQTNLEESGFEVLVE